MSKNKELASIEKCFAEGHKERITSVAFNPCPSSLASTRKYRSSLHQIQIASASSDGCLNLWNYTPGGEERVFRFQDHDSSTVHHLAFSPNGKHLASCSDNNYVKLWLPKRSGEHRVHHLKGHNGAVRYVDFSHHKVENDSLLVTCSDDKTLKLWKTSNRTFIKCMVGHNNWVRSCKFSMDSKFVASGSDDGTIKLWDVSNGENVVSYLFPSIKCHQNTTFEAMRIKQVQFHPTMNLLAAVGGDGNVHIYDLRSDSIVHSMHHDKDKICNISFLPTGSGLITINNDGSLALIDTRKWKDILSLHHPRQTMKERNAKDNGNGEYCCSVSTDGSRFVTAGLDKRIVVWKASFDRLLSKTSNDNISTITQDTNLDRQFKNVHLQTESADMESKLHSNNKVSQASSSNEPCTKRTNENNNEFYEVIGAPLTGVIDHIILQLDTITNTMIAIEKRLTIQEEKISCLQRQTLPKQGD